MTYYNIIDKCLSNKKGYGVRAIKEKTFDDISDDYDTIKYLVDVCNSMEVDFDHFEDVLENFAEDYKTF